MSIFVAGQLATYIFPTTEGLLDIVAEVRISGSKLELRDPAVYSGAGERIHPGVRQMLQVARQVEQMAKLQGFTLILVTGKRLSGAMPGRAVFLERRVR